MSYVAPVIWQVRKHERFKVKASAASSPLLKRAELLPEPDHNTFPFYKGAKTGRKPFTIAAERKGQDSASAHIWVFNSFIIKHFHKAD